MLVIFSGLPGTGKTAIAQDLARQIGAVYLRIDSIEQAIRASAMTNGAVDDLGYRIAYAVAEDNLRIGLSVVADSVNPIRLTRDAWLDVARRAGVRAIEIEVKCTDLNEHRRRVETRSNDILGSNMPTWADVVAREYHSWQREHIEIDTAMCTKDQSIVLIRRVISELLPQ